MAGREEDVDLDALIESIKRSFKGGGASQDRGRTAKGEDDADIDEGFEDDDELEDDEEDGDDDEDWSELLEGLDDEAELDIESRPPFVSSTGERAALVDLDEGEDVEAGDIEGEEVAVGYILAKAARYLELGPERYRAGDALDEPPRSTSNPMLARLESGCRQLVEGRGRRADNPLTGLDIDGFYALLSLFHFRPVHQRATFDGDDILDKMDMVHVVDEDLHLTLYNLVASHKKRRR